MKVSIFSNCPSHVDVFGRVLTVHGSEDDVVSVEDALEFDKLIVNHELFIIDGADHRFRSHVTELGHGVVKRIQDDKLSVSE